MDIHKALAKLAPTKGDGFITRTGGPIVRNAVGAGEQVLHRYVVGGDVVEAFDASPEDLKAEDWEVGSFAVVKARLEAKADAEAKAKAKADADKPPTK